MNPGYHPTNFRKNITLYWRQFYPTWTIPIGYHVHHITPRCLCKQEGWSDEQINHPRNLVALHPDDHVSIHKCRGDIWANETFLKVLGNNSSGMEGKNHTVESKRKISNKLKGRKLSPEVVANRRGRGNPFYGKQHTIESKQQMSASSQGQGKGKIVTKETRDKLSKSKLGVGRPPFSTSHKEKIAASMKLYWANKNS